MFYGLRIWPISALGFRVLCLNHTDFQVLRCVAGCEFGQFLCLDFWSFIHNFLFWGFQSHIVQSKLPDLEGLK